MVKRDEAAAIPLRVAHDETKRGGIHVATVEAIGLAGAQPGRREQPDEGRHRLSEGRRAKLARLLSQGDNLSVTEEIGRPAHKA